MIDGTIQDCSYTPLKYRTELAARHLAKSRSCARFIFNKTKWIRVLSATHFVTDPIPADMPLRRLLTE
jgi:hypothetical protein